MKTKFIEFSDPDFDKVVIESYIDDQYFCTFSNDKDDKEVEILFRRTYYDEPLDDIRVSFDDLQYILKRGKEILIDGK